MSDPDLERLYEAFDTRLYGKYRGTVTDNVDPLGGNRIEASVPAVLGRTTHWAMPCVPYAGPDIGFHALPPVGASVWIEFEGGDRDRPIWSGCFWSDGELPDDANAETVLLRTPGATIRIEDGGTVEIETTGGTKLVITGTEITLEAPSIKQSANGGATELSAAGFDAQNGAFKVV